MALTGDKAAAERQRRYRATPKGKAANDRYVKSDKRVRDCRKYTISDKGKANRKRYKKSEGGRRAIQRYHDTENGKLVFRSAQLKMKVGITIAEKMAELAQQGGRCACCGAAEPGSKIGWHTDHCHKTKQFRAVLCHHCNLALGNVKDSIETLRLLIQYLERHQ